MPWGAFSCRASEPEHQAKRKNGWTAGALEELELGCFTGENWLPPLSGLLLLRASLQPAFALPGLSSLALPLKQRMSVTVAASACRAG